MRKRIKKYFVSLIIILVCVASIQWGKYFLSFSQDNPMRMMSRRVKGNPKAPVKIIEYVDFRCGPCGRGTRWIKRFMKNNPEKLFVEVRYYPLHLQHGAITARLAECALRQGKFWEIHDALFGTQRHWVRLANAEDYFLELAAKNGLDLDALKACWNDPLLYDEIIDIKYGGKEMGVTATPTYFINDEMVVGVNNLSKTISSILNIKVDP